MLATQWESSAEMLKAVLLPRQWGNAVAAMYRLAAMHVQ